MSEKTMAEVLAEHGIWGYNGSEVACWCNRRNWMSAAGYAAHQAAALSAAGFGLVADAKAEALEEAANECDRQERFGRLPWNDLTDEQRAEYRSWARLETNQAFLRARAAALRGDS